MGKVKKTVEFGIDNDNTIFVVNHRTYQVVEGITKNEAIKLAEWILANIKQEYNIEEI